MNYLSTLRQLRRWTRLRMITARRVVRLINFRATVKDLFDYIQMLAVLAVISAVSEAMYPGWGNTVQKFLCLGAALFVSIPFARFQTQAYFVLARNRMRQVRVRPSRIAGFLTAINLLAMAPITAAASEPLVLFIKTTVVVDQAAAARLRDYREIERRRAAEERARCLKEQGWLAGPYSCPPSRPAPPPN